MTKNLLVKMASRKNDSEKQAAAELLNIRRACQDKSSTNTSGSESNFQID